MKMGNDLLTVVLELMNELLFQTTDHEDDNFDSNDLLNQNHFENDNNDSNNNSNVNDNVFSSPMSNKNSNKGEENLDNDTDTERMTQLKKGERSLTHVTLQWVYLYLNAHCQNNPNIQYRVLRENIISNLKGYLLSSDSQVYIYYLVLHLKYLKTIQLESLNLIVHKHQYINLES